MAALVRLTQYIEIDMLHVMIRMSEDLHIAGGEPHGEQTI